ncbi:MAG: lipid-A-disaccharide synthase [Kiritimatiellae bacterium]|nr:lipid-A-disaccharide synthase [Kiritimatiellia bacterium]
MNASLLVVAGEMSGDLHAASLLRALRARCEPLDVWGVGGDALAHEGVRLLAHVRDTAVMGFVEVLRHLRFFVRLHRRILAEVERRPPQLAMLVDYPGFNLRLARDLRRRGIRIVYFICPQVWAWHRSRIPMMARRVHRLIAIFPFEPDVFRGTGLRVDFVGHPLVDQLRPLITAPPPPDLWPPGSPRVALLPGSRRQEISRILPCLAAAAKSLREQRRGTAFLIAAADSAAHALIRPLADATNLPVAIGRARDILRSADAAWVASGTATVEAALLGCPQVIVYRAHPLSYAIGRRLVRVRYIGMANLIAGEQVCPELIQHQATPAALTAAILPLIEESAARRDMLVGYERIREQLGPPGAAERAAAIVADELHCAAS